MKNTGELLKAARQSKKLSLHEIGMSLKINPKTLQAIEDGDTTKLPSKTFLRGFVKSYAQFLKIETKPILDSFDQEMGETRPLPAMAKTPEAATANVDSTTPFIQAGSGAKLSERAPSHIDRSSEQKAQRLVLIMGGLILVAVIVIVARLVNKYQKERGSNRPRSEIAQQNEIKPLPAPELNSTDKPAELAVPTTETGATPANPTATLPVNGAPLTLLNSATTPPPQAVIDHNTKAAAPSTPASTEKLPEKAEKKTAVASAEKTTEAEPTEEIPEVKPQEVILEAHGKVEVSYTLGDGRSQKVKMDADEIHTFKSKTKIALELSDGGAVSLIVNGREKGTPGKPGEPLILSYPK